jgi:hypothetical protein
MIPIDTAPGTEVVCIVDGPFEKNYGPGLEKGDIYTIRKIFTPESVDVKIYAALLEEHKDVRTPSGNFMVYPLKCFRPLYIPQNILDMQGEEIQKTPDDESYLLDLNLTEAWTRLFAKLDTMFPQMKSSEPDRRVWKINISDMPQKDLDALFAKFKKKPIDDK